MKVVWGLAVISFALLMTSQMSGTAGANESTTTWGGVSEERNDNDNVTAVSSAGNHSRTEPVTVPPAPPPIYSTGVLSAAEFREIREKQLLVVLVLEPIVLVLLVLSAIAFLHDRHSPCNVYLAAICLFESWYLLMLFCHYMCSSQRQCGGSRQYVWLSIWSVSYTGMCARRCVYILNGLVSFQRFVAIAFPLKARTFRLLQRPCLPLVVVFIFCCLLHLYRPLQYTPVLLNDGQDNMWTQGFSSLFKEHKNAFLVAADVAKYLANYLPLLICLISNCLLVIAFTRHKKHLRKVNNAAVSTDMSKNKIEGQMTVTILGSTFLMVFLNTPININEAVSMYSDHYGMVKQDHYLYIVMRSAFSIVTQACDIVLIMSYLILCASFRHRFFGLFRPVRHMFGWGSPDKPPTTSDIQPSTIHSIAHT